MDRREFVQRYMLSEINRGILQDKEPADARKQIDTAIVNAKYAYRTIDADADIKADIKEAEALRTARVETRNASTYYNAITGDDNGQA